MTPAQRLALFEANQGAIINCTKRYFSAVRFGPMQIDDLVQETKLRVWEVWEMLDKFDPARGRISTFIYAVVSNHAVNVIRQQRDTIRLPAHIHEKLHAARRGKTARPKDRMPKIIPRVTASLDAPLSDGTTTTLADMLGSETNFDRALQMREIADAMCHLTKREQEAVRLHDLLDYTYADIGARWHTSRQNVESIYHNALRKLRIVLGK